MNVSFPQLTKCLSNHKATWQKVSTDFYGNQKKNKELYLVITFFFSPLKLVVISSFAYFCFLPYLQLICMAMPSGMSTVLP